MLGNCLSTLVLSDQIWWFYVLVVLCVSVEHWVLCLILHAFASLHVYPLVLFVYYL